MNDYIFPCKMPIVSVRFRIGLRQRGQKPYSHICIRFLGDPRKQYDILIKFLAHVRVIPQHQNTGKFPDNADFEKTCPLLDLTKRRECRFSVPGEYLHTLRGITKCPF